MLIKICGLCNHLDAEAAVEAGATGLGFVMGGKVLPVEIEPHAQTVRKIIKSIPAKVDTFVVTHLSDPDDIVDLANYVNASGIQISEDVGIETLRQVRAQTTKKIIKTVAVQDDSSIARLLEYEPHCDFILLDTYVAGYVGGTGATSDWQLCKQMIAAATKPVYLAGGLNPENLSEAITTTRPQGVDVSTGVSHYSDKFLRKDRKDHQKIKEFVEIARSFALNAIH